MLKPRYQVLASIVVGRRMPLALYSASLSAESAISTMKPVPTSSRSICGES
jgi:hypothetical protein